MLTKHEGSYGLWCSGVLVSKWEDKSGLPIVVGGDLRVSTASGKLAVASPALYHAASCLTSNPEGCHAPNLLDSRRQWSTTVDATGRATFHVQVRGRVGNSRWKMLAPIAYACFRRSYIHAHQSHIQPRSLRRGCAAGSTRCFT